MSSELVAAQAATEYWYKRHCELVGELAVMRDIARRLIERLDEGRANKDHQLSTDTMLVVDQLRRYAGEGING